MSNLRHWRARTTSATSSSTSATRRVAVAEELLRDLSKLGPAWPLPAQSLHPPPAARSLSFTCATPRLLAGYVPAAAGQASTMAGSGGGKPGALPCRSMLCADVPRALQVGTFVRFLEALPCLRLAQQIACTHPGLRCCLHSPARARGAPWFSSQATVELRPSRWLQRCSVPAFWFLHVLHAPDAVLHGPPWRLSWRLPNSDSSVCAHGCRGRAGYLNCGLAPCTPDIR